MSPTVEGLEDVHLGTYNPRAGGPEPGTLRARGAAQVGAKAVLALGAYTEGAKIDGCILFAITNIIHKFSEFIIFLI